MSGVRIEFTNSAEIRGMLDSLPRAYEVRVQRAMIKDALKPMMTAAKAKAPIAAKNHRGKYGVVKKGLLKRSIGMIELKRSRLVSVILAIRVTKQFAKGDGGWYGIFVERGHKTRLGTGASLRRRGSQAAIVARPFMMPAFESKKAEAVQRYTQRSREVFMKAFNRWKAKGKI